MEDRIEFTGKNLEKVRTGKGLSIRAAAKLAQVSPAAWCGYESESTSPTVDQVRKIARKLEVKFEIV